MNKILISSVVLSLALSSSTATNGDLRVMGTKATLCEKKGRHSTIPWLTILEFALDDTSKRIRFLERALNSTFSLPHYYRPATVSNVGQQTTTLAVIYDLEDIENQTLIKKKVLSTLKNVLFYYARHTPSKDSSVVSSMVKDEETLRYYLCLLYNHDRSIVARFIKSVCQDSAYGRRHSQRDNKIRSKIGALAERIVHASRRDEQELDFLIDQNTIY